MAGEFTQHDFGKLTVPYLDGSSEKLTFFAARMKYSRMVHVCLVEVDRRQWAQLAGQGE